MDCASLPDTGGPAATWLAAGLFCLGAGWWLLCRDRSRRPVGPTLVVLLVVGAGFLVAQPSPSHAAMGCETPAPLLIAQTSTIAGLGPSVRPAAIAGTVTNVSLDSTYVTDVTVHIASVIKAVGSVAGVCSAADYLLANARMPVRRMLPELSSLRFSGASLGFRTSSRDQNACKGATVHLGYVSGSR